MWKQPKCHCDMLLPFPWSNACAFIFLAETNSCVNFGQGMARVDTSFAHLSRAFREPFAINRKNFEKKMGISHPGMVSSVE